MSELRDWAWGCLAPADVMAEVAAEVFDKDRGRFEAHRDIVEVLVR